MSGNDKDSPAAVSSRLRAVRDQLPHDLALRLHRAASWLKRAESEPNDPDVRFILLWIAFNAAYAHEIDRDAPASERDQFATFFEKLAKYDTERRIYDLIWTRFAQEIRVLLMNQFIFAPFWAHHNGQTGFADWEERLAKSRRSANNALVSKHTITVLSILFDRLYMLRNQLVHGGATWSSQVNRTQVRDGAAILGALLPRFLHVMIESSDADWGKTYFPVVET